MGSRHIHLSAPAIAATRLWSGRTACVVAALLAGAMTRAQAADVTDPVERSILFIDRSSEATELFNANRPEEALAIFQELLAGYADLDEDGYVAVSVGDCLAALGRDDEARNAYRSAAALNTDLASTVSQRLIELELVGNPTDATIDLLREAALSGGEGRRTAEWRLGRALQLRAEALLREAGAVFRSATAEDAAGGPGSLEPVGRLLSRHAALLDEVVENLSDLIRRAESEWGSARFPVLKRSCDMGEPPSDAVVTEKSRSEWEVRMNDGRRVELRSRRDGQGGEVQVTANGKPITLSRTQQLMVRRHEVRINAILLEAAEGSAEVSPTK